MKKAIITLIMTSSIVFTGWYGNHYTVEANIHEVNGNITTIEDARGQLWDIESTEFEVGQQVKVRFNTNGTDNNIYDDEVEKVKVK